MPARMRHVATGWCAGLLFGAVGQPAICAEAGVVAAPAATPTDSAAVRAAVDAWSRGDHAEAVRQWQVPAARGDADAQFNLGQAYRLGRGVATDLARAEDLYGRAARQGHVRAADAFGLVLFRNGRVKEAMPWLAASAERGEPRAMYLVGTAHFNGDHAEKDWVRAYALMNRAASAGLTQAAQSLATMDSLMPMEQRQKGISLAAELDRQAQATRSRQLAAADLGAVPPPVHAATAPVRADAVPTAGADYAEPVPVPAPMPLPAPVPGRAPVIRQASVARAAAPRKAPAGPWRIQLGAFSQKANADALWTRLKALPALSGHSRIDVSGGGVLRLQAGGFPSPAEAARTCAALGAGGTSCMVLKP